ncbi:UNVERIFIED_CONTAM: hypothetical protein K2H54_066690 [Gekko kuhli]
MTVEDDVSKLDNLKKRALPRFYIDGDKSTSLLENMGKILLDKTDLHSFGDSSIKPSSKEQGFKSGTSPRGKTKHAPLVEGNDLKILAEECDVQLDGSCAQIQQMLQLPTTKYLATLPQTVCTPDVIIEEIIEDYPEKYPEDTRQRKLFQKQLVPFGLKAGARIFVKSKEHGMWWRATVIELIPKRNTNEGKPCGPTKHKICDVAMMQVFFIDFGHSEALAVSGYE